MLHKLEKPNLIELHPLDASDILIEFCPPTLENQLCPHAQMMSSAQTSPSRGVLPANLGHDSSVPGARHIWLLPMVPIAVG